MDSVRMGNSELGDVSRILEKERMAEKLFRTKNSMGSAIDDLGDFGGEFLSYVRQSAHPMNIADFGVGYGFTTRELLKAGATVTANDLSEDHLKVLWDTVTEDERSRLQLVPGNAVDLDFPDESFDGIMACRWFNFLTRDETRTVLKKFYTWLLPGGKLCVTMESVYSAWYVNEYPKYLERKANGVEWPGVFRPEEGPQFEARIALPAQTIHYDEDMLRRELEQAGFVVEKIGYEGRPTYLAENQVDGREGVGAIARKMRPTLYDS